MMIFLPNTCLFSARKLSSNLETSLPIIYYHQLINRTAFISQATQIPLSPSLFLLQTAMFIHWFPTSSLAYSAWSRSNYLKHHCGQGIPLHKTFPWFSLVLSRKPVVYCIHTSKGLLPIINLIRPLPVLCSFLHLFPVLLFTLRPLAMVIPPLSNLLMSITDFYLVFTSEKSLFSMTTHPDPKPC